MVNGGLRIGQVAKRTGLDVRLIRHYEKIGLIPSPRRSEGGYASSGYRLFTEEHVQRLEFIGLARLLDLPLREIGDLLSCVDDGCCTSARPRLRDLLAEKLQEVEQRITMLQDLKNRIQDLYQQLPEVCQCQGTEGCAPASSPILCAFGEASVNLEDRRNARGRGILHSHPGSRG
jgi:DNA-binding transcriptional MerR regulator